MKPRDTGTSPDTTRSSQWWWSTTEQAFVEVIVELSKHSRSCRLRIESGSRSATGTRFAWGSSVEPAGLHRTDQRPGIDLQT